MLLSSVGNDRRIDRKTLDDLAEFARIEWDSGDIEPWAATLTAMQSRDLVGEQALNDETALWAVHSYNATDDLHSAFRVLDLCPRPTHWPLLRPEVRTEIALLYCGGERRNLRGGRLARRFDSYVGLITGQSQREWLADAVISRDPYTNFEALMLRLQHVWGVGRLAAFEWAEFLGKVGGLPVDTSDGALWQSSGPRESLEKIFNGGAPAADVSQLNSWAYRAKTYVAEQGTALSWFDFETVICDFNVMRKGRYYPGKHLAMISEEIETLPEPRSTALWTAYRAVIPARWHGVPPGVNKELARVYRETGKIAVPEEVR